jgi:hypothetical protein
MVGDTVTLFDKQTRRAAQAEINRERKSDRTTAYDQDRSFQGRL